MLVVGALRDVALAAEHPLAEALGELVREGGSEWLRLRGLDEAAVAALIETMAGLPPPAGLAAAVHARTDGNPLYVTEVVRALVAAGPLHPVPPDEVWRLPVPDTVRATIARRLGQRSAGCREVLTLAALFGREFQVDALTRASGRDAREVLGAVDEAEAARLVTARPAVRGRYRFVHALVNETLVDALGPARRSALHREAAAALAADPRAEELAAEIAYHHHAAGAAGDPAAAVAWAARAGERALELLAYEEAARLYRLALDALGWGAPDVPREAELLLALGDACKRAGDVVAAKASFLRAAELGRRLGAPELLTRAALGFAPTVTYAEQPAPDAAVTSLLEEAIAAWGERDSGLHAVRARAPRAGPALRRPGAAAGAHRAGRGDGAPAGRSGRAAPRPGEPAQLARAGVRRRRGPGDGDRARHAGGGGCGRRGARVGAGVALRRLRRGRRSAGPPTRSWPPWGGWRRR